MQSGSWFPRAARHRAQYGWDLVQHDAEVHRQFVGRECSAKAVFRSARPKV